MPTEERCAYCDGVVDRADKDCPHCKRRITARALLEHPPEVVRATATREAELATTTGTKKCPYCAEDIQAAAVVCRYCHRDLAGAKAGTVATASVPKWNSGVAAVLSLLLPGAGQLYKGQVANGIAWFAVVIVGYVLFILIGLVLHVCCIVGAASGDPYK